MTITILNEIFGLDSDFGATVSYKFNNKIVGTANNPEDIIIGWRNPIASYAIQKDILNTTIATYLLSFADSVKGSSKGFLFEDFCDNSVTAVSDLSPYYTLTHGLFIPLSGGSGNQFQLGKVYSVAVGGISGGVGITDILLGSWWGNLRPITRPNLSKPFSIHKVNRSGVNNAINSNSTYAAVTFPTSIGGTGIADSKGTVPATAYSVAPATGIITVNSDFLSYVGGASNFVQNFNWLGSFYVPVRFTNDNPVSLMQAAYDGNNTRWSEQQKWTYSLAPINLTEIREFNLPDLNFLLPIRDPTGVFSSGLDFYYLDHSFGLSFALASDLATNYDTSFTTLDNFFETRNAQRSYINKRSFTNAGAVIKVKYPDLRYFLTLWRCIYGNAVYFNYFNDVEGLTQQYRFDQDTVTIKIEIGENEIESQDFSFSPLSLVTSFSCHPTLSFSETLWNSFNTWRFASALCNVSTNCSPQASGGAVSSTWLECTMDITAHGLYYATVCLSLANIVYAPNGGTFTSISLSFYAKLLSSSSLGVYAPQIGIGISQNGWVYVGTTGNLPSISAGWVEQTVTSTGLAGSVPFGSLTSNSPGNNQFNSGLPGPLFDPNKPFQFVLIFTSTNSGTVTNADLHGEFVFGVSDASIVFNTTCPS